MQTCGVHGEKLLEVASLLYGRACLRSVQEEIETLMPVVVQAYNRFHMVNEAGKERVGVNDIIGARISRR
jgi:hypothetical protein